MDNMKNSDIHNGLLEWEVRKLIAHELETIHNMDMENQIVKVPYDREDVWGYVVQDCKNQIKFFQERMKIAELRKGLSMLIAMRGWEEFDVSDVTVRNPGQNYYQSFIGTSEEYDELLEKIENEK
jgi:choline kinase